MRKKKWKEKTLSVSTRSSILLSLSPLALHARVRVGVVPAPRLITHRTDGVMWVATRRSPPKPRRRTLQKALAKKVQGDSEPQQRRQQGRDALGDARRRPVKARQVGLEPV